MPIFLAAVFTGLTYPIYSWLLAKTKRKVACRPAHLAGPAVVLVLPLVAMGSVAYQEAVHFFAGLDLDTWRGKLEGVITCCGSASPACWNG